MLEVVREDQRAGVQGWWGDLRPVPGRRQPRAGVCVPECELVGVAVERLSSVSVSTVKGLSQLT